MSTESISPSETLLGFDFGDKKIGVAVGQTLSGTASPLCVIKNVQQKPDWQTIEKLLNEWKPQRLIVGIPLNMYDERQEMTDRAERFMRQLNGRFHLPVEGVDERLSTREAGERIQSLDDIDAVAAQVILETWLNK